MSAILRALELDHDQVGILINTQKINAPLTVFSFAEFLGHNQSIGRDHINLGFQKSLEIFPFSQRCCQLNEGRSQLNV